MAYTSEELRLAERVAELKAEYESIENRFRSTMGRAPKSSDAIWQTLLDISEEASRARDRLRSLGEDELADAVGYESANAAEAYDAVNTAKRSSSSSNGTTAQPVGYTYDQQEGGTYEYSDEPAPAATGTGQPAAPGSPAAVAGWFQTLFAPFGEAIGALTRALVNTARGFEGLTGSFFSLAIAWLPAFFVAFFVIRSLDLDLKLDAGILKGDIGK